MTAPREPRDELREAADRMREHLRWFAMRQWPFLLAPEQDGIAFIRRSGAASAAIEDYDRALRLPHQTQEEREK